MGNRSSTFGDTRLFRCLLLLWRFCMTAWFGAATFFVLTIVDLRGSPLFDAATKLNHPRVLFPLFYGCEFGFLSVASACSILAIRNPNLRNLRLRVACTFTVLALCLAVGDAVWIYVPLDRMIGESPLPPQFRGYHQASMVVNAIGWLVTFIAALLLLWPAENTSQN